MSERDYVSLACGCIVLGGHVQEWCDFHIENQPRMGDPLDLHFRNLPGVPKPTEANETE